MKLPPLPNAPPCGDKRQDHQVAKVNGTWLIWFNGEPAYCCTLAQTPAQELSNIHLCQYFYGWRRPVCTGDHYGNQYRIWGGLTQLSLGMQELPPVALSAEAPSLLDFCRTIYTNAQMQIIENYPDSTAAKILMGSAQTLLEGTDAYASARGYYTYIYQPGRAGWQTVAVIGPEISDDEPNPKPIVQEIYANWEAPAQTASGSFDFDYGIITNKVQLKTTEKVDGATIEIEPITKSGTIDGGTWNISPADKQTVTTAGHTNDDNFQNNGGAASASWTLHYSVSKTTDSRSGRVGPTPRRTKPMQPPTAPAMLRLPSCRARPSAWWTMRLHLQRQNWRTSNSAMRKWVFLTVLKCIGAAMAATRPFLYRPIPTMLIR